MKSWLTPQGPEPTPAYLEEYIGDRLLRVSVIFIILLTLTVLARFWAKTTVVSKLGAEDWLTIPALVRCRVMAPVRYALNFGRPPASESVLWPS